MTKKLLSSGSLLLLLFSLGGCSGVGDKAAAMSVIYIATSLLSLLLLIAYCLLIKKREPWFLLLFSAVVVVNTGYLTLSISTTLEEALLSNRIAYLGSVFLPVSMLLAIIKTCGFSLPKWAVGVILGISALVFLVAASPGYLDIYYKEVSLVNVDGATVLEKVYGPLHSLYLYYLLAHFFAMTAVIAYARISKRITSSLHAVLLLSCVSVNFGVWLMEQLVKINFEVLSVSYIVSEVFLLGISLLVQNISIENAIVHIHPSQEKDEDILTKENIPLQNQSSYHEKAEYLKSSLYTLTPTEKAVYNLYLEGKGTKDIMSELHITENTLKYHNKNIYSKLGVSSRKELLKIASATNTTV